MSKALRKVEKELGEEMTKQLDIIYSATAIAFHRYWDWGELRIKRVFQVSQEAWNECASSNDFSMIEMLENETGIEMKIKETDKGWRELAYLNAKVKIGKMSTTQFIYMRQRQKLWVGAQIMACMFLALHRKYDFGTERLQRLMKQIDDIRNEFSWDSKKLLNACKEEVGLSIWEVPGDR